jgi:nicotinate phosphoribosyltransferase
VPYVDEIRAELKALCQLRFTPDELDYLRTWRFIKSDFVDFLALFQLNEKYVAISPSVAANGEIDIRIRGPWLHTILFEVPLLAIVNEVYFRHAGAGLDFAEGRRRLLAKIALLRDTPDYGGCRIADYGTRRRYSRVWQEEVVTTLRDGLGAQLAGTSNVWLARKLNLTPLGTLAHEYLQAHQALGPRLRDSQVAALEAWAKEYRGDLGIALSDVYGLNAFLRDFDMYFCKLFDGTRHDSGDPFEWGEKVLAHYCANRVDPLNKVLVFSDGLDIPKVMQLYAHFRGRCQIAFGVGTNLTNDVGPTPLNIVIKMIRCNGQPVAKLSDSPGKNMCEDEAYVAYLRQVFEIPASQG